MNLTNDEVNLTDEIKTQGLLLDYLNATITMFWLEDFTALFLALWRIIHVCRLTGITLKSRDEVLMCTAFLLAEGCSDNTQATDSGLYAHGILESPTTRRWHRS